MATVFFSYSHKDEALRDQLEVQLAMLRRQGVIQLWHDRRIEAGRDFESDIQNHIDTDDIILLLVSPDFLASEYCYEREMVRAMERHKAGNAIVIPVILRPCDWLGAPFGKLMATPPEGRPITQWPDRDQAFLEVVRAIRGAADALGKVTDSFDQSHIANIGAWAAKRGGKIRSSNLRVAKKFTQRDKDIFRVEAFDYVAKFFENSLGELAERNAGIEVLFRRVSQDRFSAVVYRGGQVAASCTIFTGGMIGGDGIAYSASETLGSSSYNECLTVSADDQSLFLKSFGMSYAKFGATDEKLSLEGAAELYWSMLIEPLQRNY